MNPMEPGAYGAHPDFDIGFDRHGRIALLHLKGRLAGVASLVLQQYLVKVLVARIPPLFIVNVEGLTETDDSGRETLRSADRHARASGGRMIVAGGGGALRLELGALDLVESVDDAFAELTRSGAGDLL
ncbi:hypothetical protein E1294_08060 [Nonomuraea diastatica]|uniref:STAS domain-containing protein n=2 Tax=Nonomuraea TaxID=83681 RepID=A0A4R4X0L1_9ACTN|nr:hypothetical protein E1294_08060 [Nonomuraea diastatica]